MAAGYENATFYSRTSRGFGVVLAIIAALGVVNSFVHGGVGAGVIATVVWMAGAALIYVLFWRPRLDVRDTGITVVNPFRTHRLDWASVDSVEGRGLLTIITKSGTVAVWAVPRPSVGANIVDIRRDAYGLPDYGAEQRHERQDAAAQPLNAALAVIEARLKSR